MDFTMIFENVTDAKTVVIEILHISIRGLRS